MHTNYMQESPIKLPQLQKKALSINMYPLPQYFWLIAFVIIGHSSCVFGLFSFIFSYCYSAEVQI